VLAKGNYELFETLHRHRILVLGSRHSFMWLKAGLGDITVRTSPHHAKRRSLKGGWFLLVDFRNHAKFKDMQHLFLENGDRYRVLLLPNGLPSDNDLQKRVVATRTSIAREELEKYVEHLAQSEFRKQRPGGRTTAVEANPPIANFNRLTVDQVIRRLRRRGLEELLRAREYERVHKNRKTLLRAIDELLEQKKAT
jgi:hypothetical protein